MKVRITKIEECMGGISICMQYHEPEDFVGRMNIGTNESNERYIHDLSEFDKNVKKIHLGDIMELIK